MSPMSTSKMISPLAVGADVQTPRKTVVRHVLPLAPVVPSPQVAAPALPMAPLSQFGLPTT